MTTRILFRGDSTDPKSIWGAVYQALGAASVCWTKLGSTEFDSMRASKTADELLAYIESGKDRDNLSNRIGEAIRAASTCWESLDGMGKFDEKKANQIADELLAYIERSEQK